MKKIIVALLVAFTFPLVTPTASAKTVTQIKNENRAKEYKARKAAEKSAKGRR